MKAILRGYKFLGVWLLLVLCGVYLGWSFLPSGQMIDERRDSEYSYLNKTVVADLGKHFIINFGPLRKEFEQIMKRQPGRSFTYFVYLGNAAWTGVNEREAFVAASTIKVPLAMAIYKAAEEKKVNLDARFTLEDRELDKNFGPLYKEGAGKDFSIRELIKIMLEQSDNTAMNALFDILIRVGIERPFDEVYAAMGWDSPNFGTVPVYTDINLKVLSNMFLSLYNATYVNLEHSNEILRYLATTPFDKQIDAGVPEGVEVSHKIGVSDPDQTYSDCGIVYAPSRHYLICAALQGGNQLQSNSFLKEVSRAAYDYVMNN